MRAEEILRAEEFQGLASPIVAVLVNKALASLTYRLEVNCHLEPVLLASREGANIYRRSLCLLLAIAAKQLYPTRRLVIGHALGRGYFYYFDGQPRTEAADLAALTAGAKLLASYAGQLTHEQARAIYTDDQPEIILMAGGTDEGGDTETELHNAHLLAENARLASYAQFGVPVIFSCCEA